MRFDLVIKGGEVVDPGAGLSGQLDVAIKRDKIAAVEPNIPADAALRVIDASGQYVTPGLVDLHTHVYHHSTYWGIDPDPVAARTGVTTWLDVGSAGAYTIEGLRQFVVQPAAVRILALINISSIGLTAPTYELANLEYCDVPLLEKLVARHRDFVYGIKARIDRDTVGANGIEPLRRARAAADACDLPIMVHIAKGPPAVEEVLPLLKAGDIVTHCFTGHSMKLVDNDGKLLDLAKEARERGVIMDIGHGAGSFSFASAESLIGNGFKPDVISSDIHQISIHGPMFDLPTCLSKFLAIGMSLPEVIEAATAHPAAALGLSDEIGTLKPGAKADLALFTLADGAFPFYDIHGEKREGKQLLRNSLTLLNGRELPRHDDAPPAPWIEPDAFQRELAAQGETPDAMAARAQG